MPRMFFEMLADVDTAQDWQFAFDTNEVVFGRDPAADITIPSQTVSRFHAAITWLGDQFILADRDSRNGTYLNDARIDAPAQIKSGDVIGLGQTFKLTFSTVPPRELELVGMTLSDTGMPIMDVVEEVLQLAPPLLLVSIGGGTPIRYTLTGQRMKLGRSDDNDIVINSPIVSRYHAEIVWADDHFELVPKPDARNRILMDGIAAERPVRLKHGATFQIGRKDPTTSVTLEFDYPNAPVADESPRRDDIFKTQQPDAAAERTLVRTSKKQPESANMLWLPRSPDVLLPSFDDILRSGPLNQKLAEGIECYALRGDVISEDVLSLPRGRLFVHRAGMFFLPLGAKKVNVADLADIGIEVAGFVFDLSLNLIPGGALIGAVGGLVGKLLQNSMHAAVKSKKPVPRSYWFQHPHTFHIPYTGVVRAGLPPAAASPQSKSSAQVFCEIGTKTQAYTFIGVGEGTRFFSEMFVAALFVNRFVQERSEIGAQVLEKLVGVNAASVKITDRYVQKHGELREEHLQHISEEVEQYVNTALEQRGYTCEQVDAMTLDKLSHFSQLPRVPSLSPIHQVLTPA